MFARHCHGCDGKWRADRAVELLALRAVAPRRAARGEVEGASLTTAEPPALRGLVLSQRDKTHHLVPATFHRMGVIKSG